MIQNLLRYQSIEAQLRKIENELLNSPERKKAMAARQFLVESEETVTKMDNKAKELISHLNKSREDYQEVAALIKEYDDTIKTLKSEDEMSYLGKKINQCIETLKNLEREIASIVREMEEVTKSFAIFKNKHNAAKAEYQLNREKFEELKKQKEGPVAQVNEKLKELAKSIDAGLLEKYIKKRADKIFPVLVPARENMCGGCSMEISLQQMAQLKETGIIECENCQRIIYI
jgi:predicted  nucleic acid-binding Zn-ribbon protein